MNGLHNMYFAWTGWLKESASTLPAKPDPALCNLWCEDGFAPLSWRMRDGQLQLIVRMNQPRTPAFVAQRVKGRWQHALREHPDFPGFKKNFFLRTLGQNQRDDVDAYIRNTIKEVSGGLLKRSAFWQSGGYIGSVGPYRLHTAMARNEKL